MWENYIKPILKTNLVALVWAFLLSFFIFFASSFLISFFTTASITDTEEIYKNSWYQIYEFIIGTIIAIVVDYKAATFLFKQQVINKIKLLNVYLLTGVLMTTTATIYFNYYYPNETEILRTGLGFVTDLFLYVFITKYVFMHDGKVNFKKLLRI